MSKSLIAHLAETAPDSKHIFDELSYAIRKLEPSLRIIFIAAMAELLNNEFEKAKDEQYEKYQKPILDFFDMMNDYVEKIFNEGFGPGSSN